MDNMNGTCNNKSFSREEKPYGKSWEDWSAEWWKWVLEISSVYNPILDLTGELQHLRQTHLPDVFFLAGTHNRKTERKCMISAKAGIFFPVATMSVLMASFHI